MWTFCRPIWMSGLTATTSRAPTRDAGFSALPRSRLFSTAPRWRAKSRPWQRQRNGTSRQLRSGGHPPRQIDRLSDQVQTSTIQPMVEHRAQHFDELAIAVGMLLELRADLGQGGREIPV